MLIASEGGGTQPSRAGFWWSVVLVVGVALLARVLAAPFATLDSADSATRVWLGWQWLDHPFPIVSGVWGPLHFYLIGAALAVWPDPVWAPLALHVLLGALVPAVVYAVSWEMLGSRRAALLAGLAFAVYPTGIAISLAAISETPFILFLGLALLFLVRARRSHALRDAVWAGVALGLASMLRYEAWLLMPFLTALLLPRWKLIAAFLLPALIHPLVWMTGNALAYGDPFHSFSWASNWELKMMGKDQLTGFTFGAQQIWRFVRVTVSGLSLPLAALTAWGALWCLLRRPRAALWLVAPAGLFLLLIAAAARGSLVVKWQYTATFGLMLVPFVAGAFLSLEIERWKPRSVAFVAAALCLVIAVFTLEPLWRALPGGGALYAPAMLRFTAERNAAEVLALVRRGGLAGSEALVTEFYGWVPTHYVALNAKIHPDRVCAAPGAPRAPLDLGAIESFLARHPSGVLITQQGGKLTQHFSRAADGTARLGAVRLRVQDIGRVAWPPTATDSAQPVEVVRYSVLEAPVPPAADCDQSCPVGFCPA